MSPADALLAPEVRRALAALPPPPAAALAALEDAAAARYLVALALAAPPAPLAKGKAPPLPTRPPDGA